MTFQSEQSNNEQINKLLDTWHRDHYGILCYYATKYVTAAESEDIVAEVFYSLYQKSDLSYIENPKTYLFSCVRNSCLNYLKARKRRKKKMADFILLTVQEANMDSDEFTEAELLNLINEEIEKLPEQCRNVFKLTMIEGLSNAEVADKLGISAQTVRNHKSIALNTLKIAIAKKGLRLYILFIQLFGEAFSNWFRE